MPTPLPRLGRPALAASLLLAAAGACQRAEDVRPASVSLPGEWRLTATGGGITGTVTPVPADQLVQLRFNADSTYSQLHNGQVGEAGTYRLRRLAWSPGRDTTTTLTLLLAPARPAAAQPSRYRVTTLTTTDLQFDTNGGCAIGYQYMRSPAMDCTPR